MSTEENLVILDLQAAPRHHVPKELEGRVALISGVTGQDGAYLSELLLEKGYTVYGIMRRSSSFNTGRIDHLVANPRMKLVYGDLTDSSNLMGVLNSVRPDEVYSLGAQSDVKVSFDMPEYTTNVAGMGVLRLLDCIRACGLSKTRFYQASSSELFGKNHTALLDETACFRPCSPYGVAKLFAYWIVVNYREAYGLYACNGILFNHESPRRGVMFVSRKITSSVARIAHGHQDVLYLGNLDVKRDWGHARNYVEAMWLTLQQEKSDDYVLATGECRSVREFVEKSFAEIGIELSWRGSGVEEEGFDVKTQKVLVRVDPKFFRPIQADVVVGNPAKAKEKLGWTLKTTFEDLVKEMVAHDLALVANGDLLTK